MIAGEGMNPGLILLCVASVVSIIFILCTMVSVFRCNHAWEFVDKTEFPPPIEAARQNGANINWDFGSYQLQQMSKKTVVIVLRCPKCGRPKIMRECH